MTLELGNKITAMITIVEKLLGWKEADVQGKCFQETISLEQTLKYIILIDLIDQLLNGEHLSCLIGRWSEPKTL